MLNHSFGSMYLINPLSDPRWAPFVERHSAACAFHTEQWLRALSDTYGYTPFAITSCPPGTELTDAIAVCRVESWATGRRLVSLPFSDHCQPLVGSGTAIGEYIQWLMEVVRTEKYNFVELRPAAPALASSANSYNQSAAYYLHLLDTTPRLETIFNSFDKDSIQRKIRRAERERLRYDEGCSPEIIKTFYALLLRTRRRHQLPPQPIDWFYKLASAMGRSIQFRIARKDDVPVAAIITVKHRNSMIYKYGCSDERYHATGSMPFLFWRMIQEAKETSIPLVDFGRSDIDNPGLIRFKDQWGTCRTELKYYRFPPPASQRASFGPIVRAAKAILARTPDGMLRTVGRLVYRHIG